MNSFIISPILAYFNSFRYQERASSRISIILVLLLYGFFMNTESEEVDLYRYLRMLEISDSPVKAISDFLTLQETDLYRSLSISVIGMFTKNGHILMAWFGMVLGYFVSLSLRFFKGSQDWLSWILAILVLGLTFHSLAGVRHITALYLFFFGLNKYVSEKDLKGLAIMVSCILIHFSFMMMIAMLIPFYFLKDRTRLCTIIFLMSFVLTLPAISGFISNIASQLGGVFEDRAATYSLDNTDYLESLIESRNKMNWYIKYKRDALFSGLALFGTILFIKRKSIILEEREKRFLNYFLLMFSFRNLVVEIPDVGVRTTGFCCTVALYVVFLIYNSNRCNMTIRNAAWIVVFSDFLNVAYAMRTTLDYVSLWELIISPIVIVPVKIFEYL